ncbi:MAG: hypothetical protein M4D80_08630 [Myxococcota bacterium]|nr:hypothetical protein [Myxococcota bacterium]
MFLTGYIAGVHFVQTLAKLVAGEVLPRIVTVGRTSEGETEVLDHEDLESAFDHVVVCLFPYAVVLTVEGDLYRWYVCRPDVPDDMVAAIDMRAVVSRRQVTTSTPMIDGEDFDGAVFFDGFAAGLDAEDHAFQISFGTLDVMASLLLEPPVIREELR